MKIIYTIETATELIQLRNTELDYNKQPVVQVRQGEQYLQRTWSVGSRIYKTAFKIYKGEAFCRTDMEQNGKTTKNCGGLTASTAIKEEIRDNEDLKKIFKKYLENVCNIK